MIDRSQGPEVFSEYNLYFDDYTTSKLSNGIQVVEINSGTQDIIKLDLVFKCGRINESKIASAKAAIRLLREGTTKYDSETIANQIDFYGASLKLMSGMEYSSISLVCLTRFFGDIFDLWLSLITQPSFNKEELEKYKQVESQRLKNQLSKNDVISYRKFTEVLFGKDHPYGYNTIPEDILSLEEGDLKNYFNSNIQYENALVVISGRYSDTVRDKILGTLSGLSKSHEVHERTFYNQDHIHKTITEVSNNDHQTSIKIGRLLFDCYHKDRTDFDIMNTVLGGYFGSRLMKNIREEKGYTYGIYSIADLWRKGGYFYITTDVGNEYIDQTLNEIHKETKRLNEELVSDEELKMVKNYMLGQSLNLIDGPFAKAQLMKNLYTKDLDIEAFYLRIKRIKNITSHDIQKMARKYLDKNTFTTVLANSNSA